MCPHIDFTWSNYFGNLLYWIFLRQSLVLFLVFKQAYSQRICRLFIVPKSTSATDMRGSRWVVTEQQLNAIQPSLILLFTLVLSWLWHVKVSALKKNTYQGTLTSLLSPDYCILKQTVKSCLFVQLCVQRVTHFSSRVCAVQREGEDKKDHCHCRSCQLHRLWEWPDTLKGTTL